MTSISPSGGMRSKRMLQPIHPARLALWRRGFLASITDGVKKLEWIAVSERISQPSLRSNRQRVGAEPLLTRSISEA